MGSIAKKCSKVEMAWEYLHIMNLRCIIMEIKNPNNSYELQL